MPDPTMDPAASAASHSESNDSDSESDCDRGLNLNSPVVVGPPRAPRAPENRTRWEVASLMVAQRATTRFAAQWLRLLQNPEFNPGDVECLTLNQLYAIAGLNDPALYPREADLTKKVCYCDKVLFLDKLINIH